MWRPVRRELRLWGQAAWRALVGLVSRNDLTHAASIAYYSLLSLFPFLLLIISILGAVTADENDRAKVLGFVFRYFPTRIDFMTISSTPSGQTASALVCQEALGSRGPRSDFSAPSPVP